MAVPRPGNGWSICTSAGRRWRIGLGSHRTMESVRIWAEVIDERILSETVNRVLSREGVRDSLVTLSDLADSHSGQDDPGQRYLSESGLTIERLLAANTDGERLEQLRLLSKVKGSRSMGNKKNFKDGAKERLASSYDVLKTALDDACLDKMACGNEEMVRRTAESTHDLIRVYDSYAAAMDSAKKKANAIDFGDYDRHRHEAGR